MWTLILSLFLGCGAPEAPPPRDPDAPEPYRVLRGDSWATVASKRSTSPEELRRWNGFEEDDPLVPGQILWIYRNGGPPEAEPDAVVEVAVERPRPTPSPVRVERPGMALLSLLDEAGPAPDLRVASTVRGGLPGEAGLSRRGGDLATRDAVVETVAIERQIAEPASAPAVGRVARLPKAEPKRCLSVELRDPGEDGMVAAEGLGREAIVAGMRPVVGAVGSCLAGGRGRWEVHLEVVVGCDGLVYGVQVVQDGGLPAPVTACIADVARQGSFAAAAAATTFIFPIHLSG